MLQLKDVQAHVTQLLTRYISPDQLSLEERASEAVIDADGEHGPTQVFEIAAPGLKASITYVQQHCSTDSGILELRGEAQRQGLFEELFYATSRLAGQYGINSVKVVPTGIAAMLDLEKVRARRHLVGNTPQEGALRYEQGAKA